MSKRLMLVFVGMLALACSSESAPSNPSPQCAAPLQLQQDGTCACPAGTQLVGATCQAAAPNPQPMGPMPQPQPMGPMPQPQPVGPATCGAGMMPDPANPATCIAAMPATCGEGMMPDPADPAACVPATPAGPSCADADTTGDTFQAMQDMVTTKCGVCHRQSQAPRSANLQLTGTMSTDPAEDFLSLVLKPACEVDMPVVDDSGGDAALANSWLYWKVATAPGERGMLAVQPEWTVTMAACMQESDVGTLMPQGVSEPQESVVTAVRNWICAGAPGPGGSGMPDAGMM